MRYAAGGASSRAPDKPQFIAVPPSLLSCKDEPLTPDPDAATDVGVAKWEVDLMAAGCDCRDKVRAIKALQDGKPAPVTSCTIR